jgi:hypothetical protein
VPGSLDAAALRRLADPTLEIGLPPPDRVIDAVNSLPWWQNDHVSSPEPDLMAAALLVKTLSERPDKAPEWLWAVTESAVTRQLVDRLGRLAFDAMTVTGSSNGITRYLNEIVRNDLSRVQKLALFAYEPELPFGLARFAADIVQALLTTSTDEADRANYLTTLSVHLSDAGDGAGALAAIHEAVDTYRRLAQDNPARFAPELALTLNNLSNRLSNAGDGAGALVAIREAADTCRRLAHDNPARFAPALDRSLRVLEALEKP